jgi:uncharacterized protein YdcH (DUF465 family)
MKQLNLFDEHEFIDSSKKNEIQISIKSSTILSSEQKKFNKLSKKIAELESEIVMVEDNIQKLLNVFVNEISPAEEKEAKVNIEASFMLDNLSSTTSIGIGMGSQKK